MVIVRIEFVDAEAITASVAQLTDIQPVVEAAIHTASWPDRIVRAVKITGVDETDAQLDLAFDLAFILDPTAADHADGGVSVLDMIEFV